METSEITRRWELNAAFSFSLLAAAALALFPLGFWRNADFAEKTGGYIASAGPFPKLSKPPRVAAPSGEDHDRIFVTYEATSRFVARAAKLGCESIRAPADLASLSGFPKNSLIFSVKDLPQWTPSRRYGASNRSEIMGRASGSVHNFQARRRGPR